MAVCKLCHSLGDIVKKQFNDPEEHWERKKCPKCGRTMFIYRGENGGLLNAKQDYLNWSTH